MEDSEILRLYHQRNQQAIRETEQKYGALCKHMALNLTGDALDAEECVSDTMLRLWNSIPPTAPASLGGYCVTVCKRIALDRRRKKHADKRGCGEVQLCMDELSECVASPERPDEIVEQKALGETVARFLDTLPAEARVMFVLRYWSCLSVREIAQECSCGTSRVKMSLLRTRNKLKEYLEQEGYL